MSSTATVQTRSSIESLIPMYGLPMLKVENVKETARMQKMNKENRTTLSRSRSVSNLYMILLYWFM